MITADILVNISLTLGTRLRHGFNLLFGRFVVLPLLVGAPVVLITSLSLMPRDIMMDAHGVLARTTFGSGTTRGIELAGIATGIHAKLEVRD